MLTFILALIAFVVLAKLFSSFGKYKNISEENKDSSIKRAVLDNISNVIQEGQVTQVVQDDAQERDISQLQQKFPDFSSISFLSKAEEMFDSIFNAFADSHHHILKTMLTASLYEQFANNIKKREEKDLRQEILIKHKKTAIEKLELLQNKVKILVDFSVSQMSAIIDVNGVSFDNPKRLYRDVVHRWTFERNYASDSWILSNTSYSEQ